MIDMLRQRDVRGYIESEGGKILEMKMGKHWTVMADFDGVRLQVVIGGSPSDSRALLNNRAWIRRQLAAARGR
jgi:hypothetical protein